MMRPRHLVIAGLSALALVLGIGGLIAFRGTPFGFDAEWMDEILEERAAWLTIPSLVMNFLGGGWFAVFVVPLGVAAVFLLRRRPWEAMFFILGSAASAGLVQLLKTVFGRARPETILIHVDEGSFPSGHVANAATIAVMLGLIFRHVWVWAAGVVYVVLMALSRTYLGAHWISDTVGGALLGAAVAALVWACIPALHRAPGSPPSEPVPTPRD
jgi:membrane-associated phospholipid phosphatase